MDPLKDFVVQAREHLNLFEQSLLALESGNPSERRNLIDQSLRAIHSLKGDAGFLGLGPIRLLTHAMESVVEDYRGQEVLPTIAVIDQLLKARDGLAALVEDVPRCEAIEVGPLLEALEKVRGDATNVADRSAIRTHVDIAIPHTHVLIAERSATLVEWELPIGVPGTVAKLQQLADQGAAEPQLQFATIDLANGLPTGPVRLSVRLPQSPVRDRTTALRSVEAGQSVSPESKDTRDGPKVHRTTRTADAGGASQTSEVEYDLNAVDSIVALCSKLERDPSWQTPSLDVESHDLSQPLPNLAVCLRGQMTREGAAPAEPQTSDSVPSSITASGSAGAAPSRQSDPEPKHAAPDKTTATTDGEKPTSLRINVELLDRLMTLVGELTLVRNQSLLAFSTEEGAPRTIIQRLNSVTSALQETVLRTRMQPVGNLFGRFPRMVRDLARQLGKQVDLVTIGKEVELDKTVLEQLSDPLTHIIRNSIDHGLESPEERIAKGKAPTGQLILTAKAADGQVIIEIRDDGRGIDPEAIKTKVLSQRLKTEAEIERMSQRELLSMITLPGFSTAKKVTDVSGRGVGMDVVKTNLEHLEGSLTIDSQLGRGTGMILRVPLTLAIIPCLVVTVAEERYAVPQRELEEIVCLHDGSKGRVEQAFDSEVYRLRERLLPIVRLSDVLERPKQFTSETKAEILRRQASLTRDEHKIEYILVLRAGGKRFGLLVDRVCGTEEIVVKPMQTTVKRLGIFAGATIMGDGRVALIASVEGIAEHARCDGAELRTAPVKAARDASEVHRVLLFESGPDEQFALPLLQIRRIETFDTARIEKIGQHEYVTLDGVSTRILRLEQVLNVSPCQMQPSMCLMLPKFLKEPMGVLVSRIVDTESLSIELQKSSAHERGILGTAIVRDRLSLFLDIQYLKSRLFDEPIVAMASVSETTRKKAIEHNRVLLIDDTSFFRELVKRYFENAGLSVETAVDGQDGLNKLAAGDFDIVVSDIEMPVMNGWDFAQNARDRGCKLPLLALSSLNKVENEDKARQSGFNDFEEKLDHDRLIRKVKDILTQTS